MNEGLGVSPALRTLPQADWSALDESEREDPLPIETEAEALPQPAAAARLDDNELAALIRRVAHQDERALEALYDATSRRVHALVLRIVQRHALAEEVVEDCFWQVWRQAARFDAARGRPLT